jgi:hypothetical protein
VALCDHDDYWHPDKLQSLLSEFDENTTLVYSDMNIVSDEGQHIAGTYWTTRSNNYKNFASLILANTITGAASMFPRHLLSYLLPFPERIGEAYHDHWIGCVALATGRIKYVDRPLYDYIQHSSNVLGHYAPSRHRLLKKIGRILGLKPEPEGALRARSADWRAVYFRDLLRVELISEVLLARCSSRLTRAKIKVLRRISRLDESIPALIWLLIRSIRNLWGRSETLGAENSLARAVLWKRHWAFKSWVKAMAFTDPYAVARSRAFAAGPDQGASSGGPSAVVQPANALGHMDTILQKIAPLRLCISPAAPGRVNLLIPTIDLRYFFGGYITKLNLARQLAEAGFAVRIVIVDWCEYRPSLWKTQLKAFQGLADLLEHVDITYCADRATPLEVSRDDVFLATTWWTAHIAHQAAKDLGKERFLYLIQEYEPFTFPMGTFACLAEQTYSFPHFAAFSTELLRDYFRENRIGVFSQGCSAGEAHSISFQNTITAVGRVTAEEISNRYPKKLLLYARPEPHAARNMFELAVLGLSRAIGCGAFKGEWEFYGIGTVESAGRIPLYGGASLQLLPRQNQDTYRQVLRSHDLGLSLMYTPHPSLVPIEMASAGMLVVTNTYANKTREKLTKISTNIIPVEPTIEAVCLGLQEAAANIDDYERRVEGSRVEWATDWKQAFNNEVWSEIERFIKAAR